MKAALFLALAILALSSLAVEVRLTITNHCLPYFSARSFELTWYDENLDVIEEEWFDAVVYSDETVTHTSELPRLPSKVTVFGWLVNHERGERISFFVTVPLGGEASFLCIHFSLRKLFELPLPKRPLLLLPKEAPAPPLRPPGTTPPPPPPPPPDVPPLPQIPPELWQLRLDMTPAEIIAALSGIGAEILVHGSPDRPLELSPSLFLSFKMTAGISAFGAWVRGRLFIRAAVVYDRPDNFVWLWVVPETRGAVTAWSPPFGATTVAVDRVVSSKLFFVLVIRYAGLPVFRPTLPSAKPINGVLMIADW